MDAIVINMTRSAYTSLTPEERAIYDALATGGADHTRCMEFVEEVLDRRANTPCAECSGRNPSHSDCEKPVSTYQTQETGWHEVENCCCGKMRPHRRSLF